ncbi:hypothetical protein [Mesorhizobium sp. f-mel]
MPLDLQATGAAAKLDRHRLLVFLPNREIGDGCASDFHRNGRATDGAEI